MSIAQLLLPQPVRGVSRHAGKAHQEGQQGRFSHGFGRPSARDGRHRRIAKCAENGFDLLVAADEAAIPRCRDAIFVPSARLCEGLCGLLACLVGVAGVARQQLPSPHTLSASRCAPRSRRQCAPSVSLAGDLSGDLNLWRCGRDRPCAAGGRRRGAMATFPAAAAASVSSTQTGQLTPNSSFA